jgi:hypothetical protein
VDLPVPALAASADLSPYWLAGLIVAATLLLVFVLLLGGPRNDRPRR